MVALLLAAAAVLVFVAVDGAPRLARAEAVPSGAIEEASRSLRRLGPRLDPSVRSAETGPIELSAASADALAADLAPRVLRDARARLTFAQDQAQAGLSVPLGVLLPGRGLPSDWWLNLQALVEAQPSGPPRLAAVQVGGWRWPVPPGVLRRVLAWRVGDARATQIRIAAQAIERLTLSPQGIRFSLLPQERLAQQWRERLLPGVDVTRLHAHHRHLMQALQRPGLPAQGDLPLSAVLGPQLLFAQQQALRRPAGAAADTVTGGAAQARGLVQEYRLAVLAVSLWAVGLEPAQLAPELRWAASPEPRRQVALRGRLDHALHFLVSALLTMGADTAVADALGLYKELADVGDRQGSGFSFDDLAADKAGVAFGNLALRRPGVLAERLPLLIDDVFIMPDVAGLPSGLSAAEFETRFGRVNSPAYRAVLAEVERRVAALPISR